MNQDEIASGFRLDGGFGLDGVFGGHGGRLALDLGQQGLRDNNTFSGFLGFIVDDLGERRAQIAQSATPVGRVYDPLLGQLVVIDDPYLVGLLGMRIGHPADERRAADSHATHDHAHGQGDDKPLVNLAH